MQWLKLVKIMTRDDTFCCMHGCRCTGKDIAKCCFLRKSDEGSMVEGYGGRYCLKKLANARDNDKEKERKSIVE